MIGQRLVHPFSSLFWLTPGVAQRRAVGSLSRKSRHGGGTLNGRARPEKSRKKTRAARVRAGFL
jgi:hypothetical protein